MYINILTFLMCVQKKRIINVMSVTPCIKGESTRAHKIEMKCILSHLVKRRSLQSAVDSHTEKVALCIRWIFLILGTGPTHTHKLMGNTAQFVGHCAKRQGT